MPDENQPAIYIALLNIRNEKLTKHQRWCKAYEALDRDGYSVPPDREDACRWCLTGAIRAVCLGNTQLDQAVVEALKQALYEYTGGREEYLVSFNDNPQTHFKDVIAVIDAAIEATKPR